MPAGEEGGVISRDLDSKTINDPRCQLVPHEVQRNEYNETKEEKLDNISKQHKDM
jgi:hypothetical protein